MGLFFDSDEITFDWIFDENFYKPGERVIGNIEMNLKKSIKFTRVVLDFKGTVNTHILIGSGKHSRKLKDSYVICYEEVVAIQATDLIEKLHIWQALDTVFVFIASNRPRNIHDTFGKEKR